MMIDVEKLPPIKAIGCGYRLEVVVDTDGAMLTSAADYFRVLLNTAAADSGHDPAEYDIEPVAQSLAKSFLRYLSDEVNFSPERTHLAGLEHHADDFVQRVMDDGRVDWFLHDHGFEEEKFVTNDLQKYRVRKEASWMT